MSSSAATIVIGPYRFTHHDAMRTLANFDDLWATQMQGRTSEAARQLGNDLRARIGPAGAAPVSAAVLSDAWHTLRAASDALRADGQMPARSTGSVVQLSTSTGGVPKRAIESADIDFSGVVGDVQRVRVHHGRPWQALCIYSAEVIDMLRAEGHPISPGSVGENITVSGLDWTDVRPGVLLQIGGMLAHVQAYAIPCSTNRQFFLGGDFNRMSHELGPVSRVYATVLRPGGITTGDSVILEPDVTGTIDELTAFAQPGESS